MQSFAGAVRSARRQFLATAKSSVNGGSRLSSPAPDFVGARSGSDYSPVRMFASSLHSMAAERNSASLCLKACDNRLPFYKVTRTGEAQHVASHRLSSQRSMSAYRNLPPADYENPYDPEIERPRPIKFKRLDKTAGHIMQILNKEAVESVKAQREIPDVEPGYIIEMRVVTPENRRRAITIKGIVIARRNSGLSTTFRIRRIVAGVAVESLFPLYSPNIQWVKVLQKKHVKRAKLYYLRDRLNPLKNK